MRPSGNCWGAVRVSIIRPTMRANHLAAWHSGRTSVFGRRTFPSCARPAFDEWPVIWV